MLGLDLLAIAGEFNRVTPDIDANASAIAAYLTNQARLRGLSTIQLIRRDRSVIVEGETTQQSRGAAARRRRSSPKLEAGQPALIAPGTTNLVGGVIKLTGFDDVYLYLARPIDPRVTRYLRLTEENAAEYQQLQANRFGVQVAFAHRLRRRGAGRAPVGDLDRPRLRPQPRLADPPADRRGRGGRRPAISTCTCRRAASTGDIGSLGDHLQHHDRASCSRSATSCSPPTTRSTSGGASPRRCCRASRPASSASTATGAVTLVNRSALAALGLERERSGRPAARRGHPGAARRCSRRRGSGAAARRTRQIQLSRGGEQRTFNVQVTQERAERQDRGPRRHARRHHRPDGGAAPLRLGRRRAPHRPRDQEPADADPALGRAAEAPLRPAGRGGGPRGLRPMHRDDRPPGRRHPPHGRRVLRLRPHAEADHGEPRPERGRARGGVPAGGRPARTSASSWSCRDEPVMARIDHRLVDAGARPTS